MDATDLKNLFYIVATIALTLFSFSVIGFLILMFRIKKIVDQASRKIDRMTAEITEQSRNLAQTWERLSIVRVFVRILKLIF